MLATQMRECHIIEWDCFGQGVPNRPHFSYLHELVNKKGDLRLAQNDLQRAKSSVHAIEKAKEKTSEMAEEFNGKILDIKDEYEDQSRDLISEYQK